MVIAAGALAATATVAGSAISAGASGSASKSQQASSAAALAQQKAQTDYTNAQELPYVQSGDNALTRNQDLLDSYNDDVTPSLSALTRLGSGATGQADLESTPGYQFTLAQGLKSTQNAAAARGLGVSGAALKGAAGYATGLSDNTYNERFANALSNFNAANTAWNTQFAGNNSLATLGGNVAAQQGTNGQNAAANSSQLITGAGNAAAAGTIGSANALTTGLGSLGSAATGYAQNQLLQQYLGNNGSQYGSSQTYNPNTDTGVISV